MDALLFALLLTLALDQGDRTQHLTLALARNGSRAAIRDDEGSGGEEPALSPLLLLLVLAAVVAASVILAYAGTWIGSYLPPRPRMLFLALAILVGGAGFLLPSAKGLRRSGLLGSRPVLAGRLLIARLNGRAGFGLLGLATFSGDPTGVAAGGVVGGLVASMMALLLGQPYLAFMARPAVRLLLGALLVIVALPLALTALGLL